MVEVEWPDLAPGLPQQAGNGAAPVSSKQPERDDEAGLHYICAPVIGTFHRSSEPGGKPFVRDGDIVGLGQQVAILEAMKMMMPVAADRAGEVVKVLVPDATPVEYGERLIAIAPAMA